MALLDLLVRNRYIGEGNRKVANKTAGEKEAIWDRGSMLYVEFAAATGGVDRTEAMKRIAQESQLQFIAARVEDVFEHIVSSGKAEAIAIDLNDPGMLVWHSAVRRIG